MWSCAFHQNVAKLVGYSSEPSMYIATKLYELDLLTFIHHPNEQLLPVLALKLAGFASFFLSFFLFCFLD